MVSELCQALGSSLQHLSDADRTRVQRGMTLASHAHHQECRQDGSPFVTHPIAVALILAEWGADADTIIAGLLHDTLEDTNLSREAIVDTFGEHVAMLVDGVTKCTQADIRDTESLNCKTETLRKLFREMHDDIRVAIIKLADRLHNVRTIDVLEEERRKRFAKETLAVYYRLAYHLGMNELRRELGDACMPHAFPVEAAELQRFRDTMMKRGERAIQELSVQLQECSGMCHLSLIPRTLSYIYEMKEAQQLLEEDSCFIAATMRDTDSCYDLLKLLHTYYHPVNSRFHDSIMCPTNQGYRSLHTTIIGPDGHRIEVRIGTKEMGVQAAKGILIHCFEQDQHSGKGLEWLEHIEQLTSSTRGSSDAFWDALVSDVLQETVQITVDYALVSVPRNASVLDAIYARYDVLGHKVAYVRLNGIHTDLFASVAPDDVLLTSFESSWHVQPEWLSFARTNYARTLIEEALQRQSTGCKKQKQAQSQLALRL